MKKNLLRFFTMALFATILTVNFTACVDDPCANVICNNGTCFDGDCVCDVGYELDPVTGDCILADPCSVVTCGDNSFCLDGACVCDAGFEEDADGNCVAVTGRFLGTFQATEPNCGVNDPYEVLVEEEAGEISVISLRNLGNYGCNDADGNPINYHVLGTVDGNSLLISNYETCSTVFNGTGTLDGNTLTIEYTATYDDGTGNSVTDNCTAILVR